MGKNINNFNLYRKVKFDEVVALDVEIEKLCTNKENGLNLVALGTAFGHQLSEMLTECKEQLGERIASQLCSDAVEFIMRDLMVITKEYVTIKINKNDSDR